MKKTLLWWGLIGVIVFIGAWVQFIEISVMPMIVLNNLIVIGLRFAIDRYGFKGFDTIAWLRSDAGCWCDSDGLTHQIHTGTDRIIGYAYTQVMWQYTTLIAVTTTITLLRDGIPVIRAIAGQ